MDNQQEFDKFFNYLENEVNAPPTEIVVEDDPISGLIIGGLVGGFVPGLFLTAGVAAGLGAFAWVAGAILGASIGYRLGQTFSKKKPAKPPLQIYGFSDGNSSGLASLGEIIPLVYCNRINNPHGGVRIPGQLVCAYISTNLGLNHLYQLYSVGMGQIGAIDESMLLIDDQPRENFYEDEIINYFRPGTPTTYDTTGQASIPGFDFYSQVVTLQNNSALGCDKRAKAKYTSLLIESPNAEWSTLTNCYATESGKNLVKNGGDALTYNATARTGSNIPDKGGFFSFTVSSSSVEMIGGLTNSSATTNMLASIRTYADGHYEVWENGASVYSSGTVQFQSNDAFKIEVTTGNSIVYKLDNVAFYTSVIINPFYPLYGAILIKSANAIVLNCTLTRTVQLEQGGVEAYPTGTTEIFIDERKEDNYGDFERFTPQETYAVVNSTGYSEFRITEKPYDRKVLKVTPPLTIRRNDEIYAIYKVKYETTKRVSEIHFNLDTILYARPKPPNSGGGKK